MDASFLYLIDEVARTMDIYLYRWPPFSVPMGKPEIHPIGSVALDGPEPSWRRYIKEEWGQHQDIKLVAVGWLPAAPSQLRRCQGRGALRPIHSS